MIVAFGTSGRVASTAIRQAREEGIKVGLFRPITLSPFPYKEIEKIAGQAKSMLVVEMNTGMMLDDVSLSVKGKIPIEFYGRLGGITPFPDEILNEIRRINDNPPADSDFNAREAWLDRLEVIVEGEN